MSDAPMSAGPYASNSLGWQLRQTAQRVSQWLEYQLAQLNPDINPPTPQWPWITALGRGLFWTLAVGLALWLSWLLYRRLLTDWRRPGVAMGSAPVPPADSTHSLHHWWQQAQAAARQGHYEAACQALYLGALQRLHDTHILDHSPSRTDGEYLQGLTEETRRPYQLLIRTHERLRFGGHSIGVEVFQRCQRAFEEIRK